MNPLDQSLTLPCGAVIKNRIFKSAMSEGLGEKGGSPKPALSKLYRIWAEGGIGLCVTGNVMIDSRALGEPGNVVVEDQRHLEALQTWAAAAKVNGTHCWVQLNHPGKQAPKGLNKENVSPSAIPFRKDMQAFFDTPRELKEDEIWDIVKRFGKASEVVKKAGFSGVQIHGAHGYLVSQFLSPKHNQRTDDWGGSPEKRRKFVREVYKAIREAVGKDFPVGIKLNSADFQRGGFTEEESLETIQLLTDLGIDLIEVSGGTYEAPAMVGSKASQSTLEREAYFMDFAVKVRKAVDVPLVLTGGFKSYQGMKAAIASGDVDMVGLARLLAIEPDAAHQLLVGKDPLHKIEKVKTGFGPIDRMSVMETVWYREQLERIGECKGPKPNLSAFWVFLKYVFRFVFKRKGVLRERAT
ncbi:NADH:flavin oxidoreductase/NADH oxidase family protein [Cecembia lonarensis]|uniref:NADH oxidase n=1 Tax=Cecembia lonarensis (strain CCUG 58316 / KCTC 22772 / LW9) TaxID=1225176 RepID=K1LYI9_CECL9|nr:NADH:flavin oxidoreductase/NADH oxidase family protein [Cecembia lonarensis]EKB49169.1 NADH oxidase [Cecembia lonarensis LW9]